MRVYLTRIIWAESGNKTQKEGLPSTHIAQTTKLENNTKTSNMQTTTLTILCSWTTGKPVNIQGMDGHA
jgi:hypothetical protein